MLVAHLQLRQNILVLQRCLFSRKPGLAYWLQVNVLEYDFPLLLSQGSIV